MRILVAEDERITLRSLERRLEGWGHRVVSTKDGAEAWDHFQRQPFDIILTDWDMPHLDGRQLIEHIRSHRPVTYTYLIMLTSRSETADVVAGLEAGADDFLAKPVHHAELHARLQAGERIINLERELASRNRELTKANDHLKAANRQIQEAQAALVQSEKLASLGSLAAGVAHELNSPIGVINSNGDVMIRAVNKLWEDLNQQTHELRGKQKLDRYLKALKGIAETNQTACSRVVQIVKSLTNFTRIDEAERKKVDLHEGIVSVLTLFQHELGERIEVARDFQDLPEIECSPSRLNQAFMDLFDNAVKAIDDRGTITIETRLQGDSVTVAFIDTGEEINPEDLSKIFDPEFTTKGGRVGSSMGLAIAFQIIEKHGGKINVGSEAGRGNRFTVTLPVDAGASKLTR
jgi:signal transduction histidine kinase